MTPTDILQQEKIELCNKKGEMQLRLSSIVHRIRGNRLEQSLYNQLSREQRFLKSAIHDVEVRLGEIKIEMINIRSEILAEAALKPKKGNGDEPTTVTRLCNLRDKYKALHYDATAAPEIRVIAFGIHTELDGVIQAALSKL